MIDTKVETNDILMDTMITKLEKQEQRIQLQEKKTSAIEASIQKIPDISQEVRELKGRIQDFNNSVKNLQFPADKLQDFTKMLKQGTDLLRQPIQNINHHHHHLKKGLIIAIASILVNFLLSSALYLSYQRDEQMEANSVKYRALQLEDAKGLQSWVHFMDSVYQVQPDRVRDFVIREEQKRLNGKADKTPTVDSNPPMCAKMKAGEKKKKEH